MPPPNKDSFIKVTNADPCPICDKPDWCSLFADGHAVICMRVESDLPTQNGGWIHFLGERKQYSRPPRFRSVPTQQERASPTILDMAYGSLRQQLSLNSQHRQDLLDRGLTPQEVQSLHYVTLPFGRERSQAVYPLIESYGPKLLQVPGFCLSRGQRIYLTGAEGLLIPCRDVDGRIIGCQIRVDEAEGGGKYRWLSAPSKQRKRGGVSSGSPLHVARRGTSERVWITEGILKADIASLRLQETVIGVAGVSNWKQDELQHTLETLQASEVIIAFDADAENNKAVRKQRMRLGKALLAMGFKVLLATWDMEQGKGLDDLLVADHTPELQLFRPAPNIEKLRASPLYGGLKRIKRINASESNTSISHVSESPILKDVDTIRFEMAEDMRKFILNSQPGEARLYQATQGLGKTYTAIHVTHTLWEQGIIRPVVASPRHNLIEENLPFPWQHIQPRKPLPGIPQREQPDLCLLWEPAEALGSKRWNVVKHLCKRECPIGTGIGGLGVCPYMQQYTRPDPLATVHETLFIPYFAEEIYRNGELPLLGVGKQVVVLDEPEPSKFVDTINITALELSKAIARCRDRHLRQLLHILHQVVNEAVHREESSKLLGREALEWIIGQAGGEETFAKLLGRTLVTEAEETNTVLVAMDALVDETAKAWFVRIEGRVRSLPKSVADPVDAECLRVAQWFAEKEKLPILEETPQELKEVPLNFQLDLLNVLWRELEQWKQGTPYNSSLVLTKTTQPTIRLNLRKHLAVPSDVPVILLDGQGNTELLSRLLERRITSWEAPATLDTNITQIVDGNYGITTLWNSKTREPKPSFWRLWGKVVKPLVEKVPEDTVLITWKTVADYLRNLQEAGQVAAELAIGHYGGVKGTNDYQERSQAILLGTPQANPGDTEELAHALFVGEAPICTDTDDVWRSYQYSDADGCGYAALVKQYKDPRMEMLAKLHREDELVQAAHRIRPVLAEGKSIYLLTALPVEELAPSRLITVNELAEKLGGMPDAREGITFELVESIARDMMAETDEGIIWFERLKTQVMTHVLQDDHKENIYGENENPQYLQGFPSDSTLYRWLQKLAKLNSWSYSQVTVERNHRGGGATWIGVYHLERFDEDFVRANYAKVWDIEPEDEVLIESRVIPCEDRIAEEIPWAIEEGKLLPDWYPLRE